MTILDLPAPVAPTTMHVRTRPGLPASVRLVTTRTSTLVVGAAWLLLALGQTLVIRVFSAQGLMAELIALFCSLLAASFFFVGALFVANAAFNNLGRPL